LPVITADARYWLAVAIEEMNGRKSTVHGYGQAILQDLLDTLEASRPIADLDKALAKVAELTAEIEKLKSAK
jgi:hypothetical protein